MYKNTYVFSSTLWIAGGVGAVIWAANHHRTGKFWWFVGGSLLGSVAGALIDTAINSKNSDQQTTTI